MRLFLVNNSHEEQTYFYNSQLQPSKLLIRDDQGNMVEPYDVRSVMKFDTTPYRHFFMMISPQEKILLQSAKIEKKAEGHHVSWDPFEYELPKNAQFYDLKAEWISGLDKAYNCETQQYEDISLWKGSVISNMIKFSQVE